MGDALAAHSAAPSAAISFSDGISPAVQEDALFHTANPASTIRTTREGLTVYRVEKGDTLSKIAVSHGITVRTIVAANKGVRIYALKPGEELVLLPISGVLHELGPDETPESIAALYEVPLARLREVNKNLAGRMLIPGATAVKSSYSVAALPSYPGYYIFPTTGWNWGTLHPTGAVDIANVCGTPVYAAAEGLVSYAGDGWDEGYGNNMIVEHPNNTSTRYAHLRGASVEEGDYVLQGDEIGTMGNTGKTDGVSGCHLHFEVRGARNPFAR